MTISRSPAHTSHLVWNEEKTLSVDFGDAHERLSTKEKAAVLLGALDLECPDVAIDITRLDIAVNERPSYLIENFALFGGASEAGRLEAEAKGTNIVRSIAPNGEGLYITAESPYFHTEMP